jgi:hypothetical protein
MAGLIDIGGTPYSAQNGERPWSLDLAESGAFRFEVRSGDQWYQDPAYKERSEIRGETVYAEGQTLHVQYDLMIEPGARNSADWLVLGQFHADDDNTSPPFAVELVGDRLAIVARYRMPGEDGYTKLDLFVDDSDIQRDVYHWMEITAKFDNAGGGSLDVWCDGEQIVDYDGPLGYGNGVYWKQGIYRGESSETLAVGVKYLSVASDGGVTVVGSRGADIIDAETSPSGQPLITDHGDVVKGAGGSDLAMAEGGDDLLVMGRGRDRIYGGDGDDNLNGGLGADRLVGGAGDDTLKGAKGTDVFAFAPGFGDDTIRDFEVGRDKLEFDDAVFANFSDLVSSAWEQDGGVMIDAGDGSLFLAGLRLKELHADDVLFI